MNTEKRSGKDYRNFKGSCTRGSWRKQVREREGLEVIIDWIVKLNRSLRENEERSRGRKRNEGRVRGVIPLGNSEMFFFF